MLVFRHQLLVFGTSNSKTAPAYQLERNPWAHSESDSLSTGIENEDGSGKGTDDLSGSGSGDSEKEMHIDTFFDYQDSWNYDYYDYSSPGTPRALEIKRVKHFAELMAKKSKLQSGLV